MEERTKHRTGVPGRLRFVLGKLAVDVALPAEVPLVDLLPAVLPQFGAEQVEEGVDHEGWVACRLGQPPLDEDRTPAELNLMDGETLYLRARADEFAPIDYDDLVDGVAEQVREHPGSWTAGRTRTMLLVGATVTLLAGLPVLLSGSPMVLGLATALLGVTALLLLFGAGVIARTIADSIAATTLVGVAACYAGATGWVLALTADPGTSVAVRFAGAALGVLAALSLGLAIVAEGALLFAGAVTFVVMLALPALIDAVSSADPASVAAIGLVVTLIAGMFVPGTAFRLAGLSLPMLPTNAEELREDIDPVPHELVVERGAATVRFLQALHLGLGGAQCVLIVMLVGEGGTWPTVIAAVLALLLFLRSRHLDGTIARWALLVPGAVAVVADLVRLAMSTDFLGRVSCLWLPVLATGLALLVFSARLPGRRLRPYWGRAVDILETLSAVAVLPLVLAELNVYELVRGLSG